MNRYKPPWEASPSDGVQFLRLYKKDTNDNWPSAVNRDELHPGFPQIVVWDLTADQYAQFTKNPVEFVNDHGAYTDKIKGISPMPKPLKSGSQSYTVVTVHNRNCTITTAGSAQ